MPRPLDFSFPVTTMLLHIYCCLVAYPSGHLLSIWHLFCQEGLLDISPASELISDLKRLA